MPRPRFIALAVVVVALAVGTMFLPLAERYQQRRREAARLRNTGPFLAFANHLRRVELAACSSQPDEIRKGGKLAPVVLSEAVHFSWDTAYGDAVHYAHLVLGRVALLDGNLSEARAQLLAAATTPGSPQLATYGPDMTLAGELLREGEDGAVLQYLNDCARFADEGVQNQLKVWQREIRAARHPDFGRNPKCGVHA